MAAGQCAAHERNPLFQQKSAVVSKATINAINISVLKTWKTLYSEEINSTTVVLYTQHLGIWNVFYVPLTLKSFYTHICIVEDINKYLFALGKSAHLQQLLTVPSAIIHHYESATIEQKS